MKNIKLGVKLIGGFFFVAFIVLVEGFFGWQGANQLNDHVDETGMVQLPGIESLLILKAENNGVTVAVRSLLNPWLTMERREVEQTGIRTTDEVIGDHHFLMELQDGKDITSVHR